MGKIIEIETKCTECGTSHKIKTTKTRMVICGLLLVFSFIGLFLLIMYV